MSIKLKRVLASVVSLAMLVTFINIPAVTSEVLAEDNPTYSLNYVKSGEGTAMIVNPNPYASGDVVIDSEVIIDGEVLEVTAIGPGAFAGNPTITSVDIPRTVKRIETQAFTMCTSLEYVYFHEGLENIVDSRVFEGCSALSFLRIPSTCHDSPHVWSAFPNLNIEYPCSETAGYTVAPGCTATAYHTGLTVSDKFDGFVCSGCSMEEKVNCIGHSITLDSMIGVNFYFEISDGILNNPAAEVQFTCNGEPYYSTPISSYEIYNYIDNSNEEPVDRTCYIYSCPVAAKQMTDIIEAQIVVPVTDTFTWTSSAESYSVVEYAGRLSSYDFNDSALNNVVKSMLIYGACAQAYFDYHTERLAYVLDTRDAFVNAVVNGIDDFPVEGTNLIFSNFGRMVTTQGPENGVQMVAADLILGSTTSMGLYFTVPEELADSTITYSVNGVNYDARRVGDRMYIRVNDIQPFNLVAAYPIEVSINGAPQSEYPMLFSPSAYAYLVAEMVDDSAALPSLQNLMRAMFLFGAYSYSYNK